MTGLVTTGLLPTGVEDLEPVTPQLLGALVVSDTEVLLTWAESSGLNGYDVYVDGLFNMHVPTNSALVVGLSPNTTYTFFVVELGDEVGEQSLPSLSAGATTNSSSSIFTNPLGSVICCDNSVIVYWQGSNAYSLSDVINVNNDSNVFAYECTTAGTSGATQPTWPSVDGDTVVDGTVVWTTRNPYDWVYALITLNKAINHYMSVAPEKRDIWMEFSHDEGYSANYSIQGDTKSVATIPAVYLVDKATNLYKANNTITPNLKTTAAFRQINIAAHIHFFGLRIESQEDLQTGSDVITFEDCLLAYGFGGNSNSLQISNSHLVVLNSTIKADNTTSNDMFFFDSTSSTMEFIGCTFNINIASTGFMQKVKVLGNQWVTYDSCDFTSFNNQLLVDTSDFSQGSDSFFDSGFADLHFNNCELQNPYSIYDGTWVANREVSISIADSNAGNSKTWLNDFRTVAGTYTYDDVVFATPGYQETENLKNLSILMTPNAKMQSPYGVTSPRIEGYFASAGSQTLRIKLLENFTVPLTKNLIWVELYYFKGVADLVRTLDKSSKEYAQNMFTPLDSSTAVWAGTPGGFTAKEILIPIANGREGHFYGIVRLLAKEAGKQVYLDTEFEIL